MTTPSDLPPDPERPPAPPTAPTEPLAASPPPPPPPPPRRLTRSSDDRVLGGVAGGLGRYFGIDPIIFRIGFAVLVFAGGAGVVAYLAAYLFVPDERGSSSQTPWQRAATVAGALILAIVAVAVLDGPFAFVGPGLVLLGLAALVGVLLWRSEAGRGAGPLLVRALAVCGIVVLAAAGTVAVAVGAAAGGGAVIAALLIVTGIAMAVAAYAGGARWMILPAAVIALPLGLVAATDLDLDGGVGDREYRPAAVGEVRDSYELGAGELTVDLRDVTLPQGRTEIDLDVGIGAAVVIVPDDVCVSTDVTLGVGGAEVLGRENGGVDVEYERGHAAAAGDVPRLVLDGHVGVGAFEVYRERYADRSLVRDWDDDWDGWDRRDRFGEDRVFAPREDGCGRAL